MHCIALQENNGALVELCSKNRAHLEECARFFEYVLTVRTERQMLDKLDVALNTVTATAQQLGTLMIEEELIISLLIECNELIN